MMQDCTLSRTSEEGNNKQQYNVATKYTPVFAPFPARVGCQWHKLLFMQEWERVNINNDAVFQGLSVLRQPSSCQPLTDRKRSLAWCQISRKTPAKGLREQREKLAGLWRRGLGQGWGGGWPTPHWPPTATPTADECSEGNMRKQNTWTQTSKKLILSIL